MELIENQPGKNAPAKSTQSQIPSLPTRSPTLAPHQPSHQPPQLVRTDAAELKRRREQKGKDVVDAGKSRPTREEDAQRATKQQKTSHPAQRGQERSNIQLPEPQAWLPAPMHGGEPLRDDASIRDFNGGFGFHMASAIEEALLLPRDMAKIKNVRNNELILNNKRYLGMIIQNTFKLDEILNSCYNQLEDERKKQAMAVQTLTTSEQDLAAAKKKLLVEEQACKSTDSALEGFQKQAEDQEKRLREANAELKATWEQVAVLKKHLEETQKLREQAEKSREEAERAKAEVEQAMNEAEQKGYEIGVAEMEETLRAEVPMLRKPENVFYPEAIYTSASPSSQAEDTLSTINPNEEVLPPSLPSPGQLKPAKGNNAPPESSLDKTAVASEAEVASQGFQQDLTSTVMPAGGATKDKEGVTTSEADKSANQAPKLQIKLKK
ncbi:golgin subfamily A member 6-like protein 6 [Quercus lobata]|uniref:golgin subfamily A member 6-like protein 6 n=1 Tax=Quercus lobata TaxID=97700 RepID=UPI001243DDAC|nr:golgin subfamily A member 6-like protein 6 [Quercus lobata]